MKTPGVNATYIGFLFILAFFTGLASTDAGSPSEQPFTSNTSFDIAEVNPKPNSLTAPRQPEISITFNAPIDRSTISESTIIVNGNQTGWHECPTNSFAFHLNDSTVTFVPNGQFMRGEIVSVTVTTGLLSINNDSLEHGLAWTFTIKANTISSDSVNFIIDSVYTFSSSNRDICPIDINNDGRLELIVVPDNQNMFWVLHGDGQGDFVPTKFLTSHTPYSCTIGDFDRDGWVDAAMANNMDSSITIFWNSNGILSTPETIPINGNPVDIISADLDANGYLDLITANRGADNISIIYNNGGQYSNPEYCNAYDAPDEVCALDFDRDLQYELAVANSYDSQTGNQLTVLDFNGNTYEACDTLKTGIFTESVGTVVLDSSKPFPSLITAFTQNNDGHFRVFQDDSGCSWQSMPDWMAGERYRAIMAADFDGDGNQEFGGPDWNHGRIVLILPAKKDSIRTFSVGSNEPYEICCGDFDNDGRIDICTANMAISGVGGISILINRGAYCEADHAIDTASMGNQYTLRTNTDQCLPNPLILYYRKGGATDYNRVQMDSTGQYAYEAIIPAESITVRGIDYYFVAYYQGDSTTSPLRNPENDPYHLCVRLPNVTLPPLTLGDDFQMIGFPFEIASNANTPQAVFEDDLGPQDDWVWRCGHWDPLHNQVKEYPFFGNVAAGQGYWIASRLKQYIDASGYSSVPDVYDTASGLEYYAISLQAGWNQIANPFCFPISWADRRDTAGLVTAILEYTPSEYISVQVLQPYSGYLVYSDSNNVTLGLPYSEASNPQKMPKDTALLNSEIDWLLSLTLSSDGRIDASNLVGAKTGADDQIDRFDVGEPPYVGEYISLSTIRKHNNDTLYLMEDFCRPNTGLYEIPLRVKGNTDSPVYLSVKQIAGGSDSLVVLLHDPKTDRYYDPIGSPSLVLPHLPSESGTQYTLIVGAKSCIPVSEDDISTIPSTYALFQNIPNPFNQLTVIQYSLPVPQHVTLSIYNVMGQTVKNLEDCAMPAGTNRTIWDGTDSDGSQVSSGVYFYQIVAGDFRESKKLTLIK